MTEIKTCGHAAATASMVATTDDLLSLRHHEAVIAHGVNRAAWAYLACLPLETWLATVYS